MNNICIIINNTIDDQIKYDILLLIDALINRLAFDIACISDAYSKLAIYPMYFLMHYLLIQNYYDYHE